MYIDDLLIIGKPETNESTINDLKQNFDIKKPTTLDDYLDVRAYVINEVVTIEFVKSNENISDIMTKDQQLSNYHIAQVNLV